VSHGVALDTAPMLAKAVPTVPEGDYLYEPKWDGFRCLVHRDGDEVHLMSRSGKPLGRYFPEIEASARAVLPSRIVLDGELVVAVDDRLEWDALSSRVHPAESRVQRLAQEIPARFVAFDLLAFDEHSVIDRPFSERRALLLEALSRTDDPTWSVTAATTDPAVAREWFELFEGAGLDGVVAKPADGRYEPGKRSMLKIKHKRAADVVVTGYRLHKQSTDEQPMIGSLQLSLFDDGEFVQVGGAGAFSVAQRRALVDELAELVDGISSGELNRWSASKNTDWVRLRPERVAEVGYDQLEHRRFRHTGNFLRWRPDREPTSCTFDQLDVPVTYSLNDVLAID
jgi:ATP-dependent DNA ligase